MAYFGSRHSATAIEKFDAVFRCESCGLEKSARARASGTGTARSPYFIDEGGARDRAIEDAHASASAAAEELLRLAPCPGCGKRNLAAWNAYSRSTWLTCIGIVAIAATVGAVFLSIGAAPAFVLAAVVGVLGPLFYARSRARTLEGAAHVVEFFEGEAPDLPYIGKDCTVCRKRILMADDGLRCKTCGLPVHRKKCKKAHRLEKHG